MDSKYWKQYRAVHIANHGWWVAHANERVAYEVASAPAELQRAFTAFARLSNSATSGQWCYFYYDSTREVATGGVDV